MTLLVRVTKTTVYRVTAPNATVAEYLATEVANGEGDQILKRVAFESKAVDRVAVDEWAEVAGDVRGASA